MQLSSSAGFILIGLAAYDTNFLYICICPFHIGKKKSPCDVLYFCQMVMKYYKWENLKSMRTIKSIFVDFSYIFASVSSLNCNISETEPLSQLPDFSYILF